MKKLNLVFSTKTYDILKWITLVLLPALATFYFAMAASWNLPYPDEIVGTIGAIDLFLGILLGLAKTAYTKVKNAANNPWVMDDKTYDMLKWVAQIFLPALSTLYFTVAKIWGLPMADEIVNTIMAIDALLGMLLQLSTSQFNKAVRA